MKKAILGLLSVGAAASALAQGTISFENALAPLGNGVFIDTLGGAYAAGGTYTVALLWAPGTSLGVAQSAFTQIGTFGPAGTQTGYFQDGATVTTGAATAPGGVGVFEVQGWQGSYANYAAAMASGVVGEHLGQTGEFLNATGQPPFTTPVNTTGWDGNLILVVPEPGTLALGGLGAAALKR